MARYVTNRYAVTDTYKSILVIAKDAKVKVVPSNDGHTKLVFFEKERRPYRVSLQDGALTVQPLRAKWYHSLRIGTDRSKIKLCLPKSTLEALTVQTNTGHVDIGPIACNGTIDIQVNTGSISLEGVCCQSLVTKGNTGSVSLNDLVAKERISIKRSTGKVLLNDCSAPEIFVKTNTGRVCGRLPSNTVFAVRTNTGKIELPQAPIGATVGGRCEIKTNTGSVKFEPQTANLD